MKREIKVKEKEYEWDRCNCCLGKSNVVLVTVGSVMLTICESCAVELVHKMQFAGFILFTADEGLS